MAKPNRGGFFNFGGRSDPPGDDHVNEGDEEPAHSGPRVEDEAAGARRRLAFKKPWGGTTEANEVQNAEEVDANSPSEEDIKRAKWKEQENLRAVRDGADYVPRPYPGDVTNNASNEPDPESSTPAPDALAASDGDGAIHWSTMSEEEQKKRMDWKNREAVRTGEAVANGEHYVEREYPGDVAYQEQARATRPRADGSLADKFGAQAYGSANISQNTSAKVGAANPLMSSVAKGQMQGWSGIFQKGGESGPNAFAAPNMFAGPSNVSTYTPPGNPNMFGGQPNASVAGGAQIPSGAASLYGSFPGVGARPMAYAPPPRMETGIDPQIMQRIAQGRALADRAMAAHGEGIRLRQSGNREQAGAKFRAASAGYPEALNLLFPCRKELDVGSDLSLPARRAERKKLDSLVTMLMDKWEEVKPIATDDLPSGVPKAVGQLPSAPTSMFPEQKRAPGPSRVNPAEDFNKLMAGLEVSTSEPAQPKEVTGSSTMKAPPVRPSPATQSPPPGQSAAVNQPRAPTEQLQRPAGNPQQTSAQGWPTADALPTPGTSSAHDKSDLPDQSLMRRQSAKAIEVPGGSPLVAQSGKQKCFVCFEPKADLVTPCGHYYCTTCCEPILTVFKSTCPQCREPCSIHQVRNLG